MIKRLIRIEPLTLILKDFRLSYMTDHDRNMRTLILCFVLAVMALLPLRVMELGQEISTASTTQVLGDTIEQKEVVLPNSEVNYGQINYGEEIKEEDLLR